MQIFVFIVTLFPWLGGGIFAWQAFRGKTLSGQKLSPGGKLLLERAATMTLALDTAGMAGILLIIPLVLAWCASALIKIGVNVALWILPKVFLDQKELNQLKASEAEMITTATLAIQSQQQNKIQQNQTLMMQAAQAQGQSQPRVAKTTKDGRGDKQAMMNLRQKTGAVLSSKTTNENTIAEQNEQKPSHSLPNKSNPNPNSIKSQKQSVEKPSSSSERPPMGIKKAGESLGIGSESKLREVVSSAFESPEVKTEEKLKERKDEKKITSVIKDAFTQDIKRR